MAATTVLIMHIVVHPDEQVDFAEFCATPAPAIALDGYVTDTTCYDPAGPWVNFNHHDGVDRFGTRATCEQVASALSNGLTEMVGSEDVAVHVNDCDADVCVATWLLAHPERVNEDRVGLLVSVEGAIDTSGGCSVPGQFDSTLEQISWVFELYNAWRADPDAAHTADGELHVIAMVHERIEAFVANQAGSTSAGTDYDVIERRGPVAHILERGPLARLRLRKDGIGVYVSARPLGDRTVVTVGRSGQFIPVDLPGVWRELNALEGCDGSDRWGGGDAIGGSPRIAGTELPMPLILEVVASHYRGKPSVPALA